MPDQILPNPFGGREVLRPSHRLNQQLWKVHIFSHCKISSGLYLPGGWTHKNIILKERYIFHLNCCQTDNMSRIQKVDEFKAGTVAVHVSFYPNLVACALSELSLSLDERRGNVVRLKNNHNSQHAVGSIVLLVTGFDGFLNEELMGLGFFNREIRELADSPTLDKYYKIVKPT